MKLNKDFILRTVAGQDVLVATGKMAKKYNGLMTLTPTARFLLENYEKVGNLTELVEKVLEEFDVSEEKAAQDVVGFTNMALKNEIIMYTDPDNHW